MKLTQALQIAKDCGLETIGEAIYNIAIHAGNIFNYGEEITEYEELCKDFKVYQQQYGYTLDTNIACIL
jgi:hypothetical protein